MLSRKTLLEIIHTIENWTTAEIDRFAIIFEVEIPNQINGQNISRARKGNIILSTLNSNNTTGPFSENIQLDTVQYVLEKFIRENPITANHNLFNIGVGDNQAQNMDTIFINQNSRLCNSLRRDGYTINNENVVALLPEELLNNNSENELIRLLDYFNFTTPRGHLEQAIENHSAGNWAGANAQFRTFMESLLISISNHLIPSRQCQNIGDAIIWLSNPNMLTPVLLQQHLNEVPTTNLNTPFINGLWKRLHPTGSHPGLSDEEDSTFRYHTLVVFTRYILSRLESRN